MSVIMQKNYRSKAEKGISYTLVFAMLFAFGMIAIGFAGYTMPELGFGNIESIIIALVGATTLLFVMNSILVKVTSGNVRTYSMILSLIFVAIVLILALLGSGILEV